LGRLYRHRSGTYRGATRTAHRTWDIRIRISAYEFTFPNIDTAKGSGGFSSVYFDGLSGADKLAAPAPVALGVVGDIAYTRLLVDVEDLPGTYPYARPAAYASL
jgi:hypothetical protein